MRDNYSSFLVVVIYGYNGWVVPSSTFYNKFVTQDDLKRDHYLDEYLNY